MNNPKTTLNNIIVSIIPDNFASDISIEESELDTGITEMTISSSDEVKGMIIGKQGKIIKSIRTAMALSYPTIRFNIVIKE